MAKDRPELREALTTLAEAVRILGNVNQAAALPGQIAPVLERIDQARAQIVGAMAPDLTVVD